MANNSPTYSIDEIRTMITAIRDEDKNARLNALSNLQVISKVLGPIRTCSELIPYVTDTVDNTDEMWSIIATQLGQMLKLVGGPNEVSHLIAPLKFICEMEDPQVYEPAIESLVVLAKAVTPQILSQYFVPLIKEMCEDGWHPLRCAGATLLCQIFHLFPVESQSAISALLPTLATDSVVLVRRSIARGLSLLIQCPQIDSDLIIKILPYFASDEAVAVTVELPKCLPLLAASSTFAPQVLPTSRQLFQSQNWQPKSVFISMLEQIFPNNPPIDFLKEIVQSSAQDHSLEVRTAMAKQLSYVYDNKVLPIEDFQQLVSTLIVDPAPSVRAAVASSLGPLGCHEELKEFVGTSLTSLLSNKEFDVKTAVFNSISVAGVAFQAATKQMNDLLQYSTWRVKLNITKILPQIAIKMGDAEFNQSMQATLRALLSDEACDVRKAAITASVEISSIFGKEWFTSTIAPIISSLFDSTDYMLRQTAVTAVFEHQAVSELQGILDKASKDSVPNVRMTLAKLAAKGSPYADALAKDSDPDVAYFAQSK